MADKKWYVLRTAGTKEKKAAEYLVKEIERHADLQSVVDQVLVPVKKEIVTKNGKRKEVERLLFPGYVLIHAELSPDLEYVIRNGIPGMSGFLTEKTGNGTAERIPVPIRDDEAARILGGQDENAVAAAETEINFTVGESVKITNGRGDHRGPQQTQGSGSDLREEDPPRTQLYSSNERITTSYGKRSYRIHQAPDQGRSCESCAAGRTCTWFQGPEHHGFLQAVQCSHPGSGR